MEGVLETGAPSYVNFREIQKGKQKEWGKHCVYKQFRETGGCVFRVIVWGKA